MITATLKEFSAKEAGEKSQGRDERVTKGKVTKERLHLVLAPRSMKRLEELKEQTESSSYTEVLKNALRLYGALVEEAEKGNDFLVRTPQGDLITYRIFI
jgi:hypothetical protein